MQSYLLLFFALIVPTLFGQTNHNDILNKTLMPANVIAPTSFQNTDVKKNPTDLVVGSGLVSYFAGAVGGYFAMKALGNKDTTITIAIVSGVLLGGSILSSTAVYIANRGQGNFLYMTGGAILSQVGCLAAGAVVGLIVGLLDAETGGWMMVGGILALPFAATLTANYICYKTK